MFIEFIIDGLDTPQLVEIGSKANTIAIELQKRKKSFRLGKTHN